MWMISKIAFAGVEEDSGKRGLRFPDAWGKKKQKILPHLLMSPLSVAPCSASGPLSSTFWLAKQAPPPS